MNQAIQFPDYESYDPQHRMVIFPALHQGMQVSCVITEQELHSRFGPGPALSLFQANRWDLEDEAEKLILSQSEDIDGYFRLSSR